ncbi:hypothetical protein niasHS_002697 [Heterodera schachtii]|uniref:WAP domain-containing protein n=1 Tax=Heterodera schachtii TaxID=97005 RepID=A0ABD2K269_HETSC
MLSQQFTFGFVPSLLIGLSLCIFFPAGGNGKCIASDGNSPNISSAQPLELGGCVNFRCPDNYECNDAYKCCLSAVSDKKNSNNSNAFGRPGPTGDSNLNFTKAVGGLKETIDGFKNFVRLIFSL